jgi:hypothetical protein
MRNHYSFDGQRPCLGIDIGWSASKKSCALAVQGLTVESGDRSWTNYRTSGRPVAVGLFRLSQLLEEIPLIFAAFGVTAPSAIAVLDGPVGPASAPESNRYVDGHFSRGIFHRRMQPVPIKSKDGPLYTEATEKVVLEICKAARLPRPERLWNPSDNSGFVICETHPTVGLGLLLPPQAPETLPTRKQARRLPAAEAPLVNAKSDWYWQLGAGLWIASNVFGGSDDIAGERHHERVAGLYCLAVASAINASPIHVIDCGDEDGAYVMLATFHQDWDVGLGRKLVRSGTTAGSGLATPSHIFKQEDTAGALDSCSGKDQDSDMPHTTLETDPQGDFDETDDTFFLLTDNGGVWTKHNWWLEGLESAVALAISGPGPNRLLAVLRPASGNNGMWRMTPTPLAVARWLGFEGQHLSVENHVGITVELLGDGFVTDA